MKLQELERSATVAWSPSSQFSNYLAVGTVAGSLDIDFDTSAHLEILSLDFSNKESLKIVGKATASDRFNKLCWGTTGIQSGAFPKGLLAGGLNNGIIGIWNPENMIGNLDESEERNPLIVTCEKHSNGSISGLDFNSYQQNLLASGGSDSEIFIWDLQNPNSPTVYNPGNKTQVHQDSDITCVQWNKKVQHILGSVNFSGVTSIWDLKVKKCVLSFSSPQKKLRCKTLAWNPEEATQIVTASEDDSNPIIELWDLRNTYSPTKILEGHNRGIWSLSWCPMDSDLLLSCAKDNRTLCWNVKDGEIQSEVEVNSETWNFDVQWSTKIPAILSTCSLERKVSIYSLQDVRNSTPEKSLGPLAQRGSQSNPPKWLKRSSGVSFSFDGKIVSFKKSKPGEPRSIYINQVVTDKNFLERADRLEEALSHDDLKQFCEEKISASSNEEEKSSWNLMKLLFVETSRNQLLEYLGFNKDLITGQIKEYIAKLSPKDEKPIEEEIKEESNEKENKDVSGLFSTENSEETSLFESISKNAIKIKNPIEEKDPIQFITDGPDGVITQALIIGNFESAVECCISSGNMADALILAAYGGPELWKKTQETYFNQKSKPYMRVVSSIIKNDLRHLVERSDLKQWKTTLAIVCTYAKTEEFAILSSLLGDRLLYEIHEEKLATQCYIISGNIEKLIQIWIKEANIQQHSHQILQNLIEKISVFRRAIRHTETVGQNVAEKYSEYAQLLASQGRLQSASHFLSFLTEAKYEDTTSKPFILLYRLYHAQKNPGIPAPPFPFQKVEVTGEIRSSNQIQSSKVSSTIKSNLGNSQLPFGSISQPVQPQSVQYQTPQPSSYQPVQPQSVQYQPPQYQPVQPQSVQYQPPQYQPVQYQPPQSQPPQYQPVQPQPPQYQPIQYQQPQPSSYQPVQPQTIQYQQPQPSSYQTNILHPTNVQTNSVPSNIQQKILQSNPPPVPSISNVPLAPTQNFVHKSPNIPPVPSVPPTVYPNSPSNVASSTPIGPPPVSNIGNIETIPKSTDKSNLPQSNTHLGKQPTLSNSSGGPTSAENLFVIDLLNKIISQSTSSTDQKVVKYAKDASKRIEPLIEKLQKNEFSLGVTQGITQLVNAIMSGDSKTAQNVHQDLTQKYWEELGSNLMIALKRLIDMTKG